MSNAFSERSESLVSDKELIIIDGAKGGKIAFSKVLERCAAGVFSDIFIKLI